MAIGWPTAYASAQVSTLITSGATLPATCVTGNLWAKTGGGDGLYVCISSVWVGPLTAAGGGDVTGPGSATDHALVRFDGATGTVIQNGVILQDDTGVLTFPDNIRQLFNPGATVAGLNVGSLAGDPSTPINGDCWYDSAANELTCRINSANVAVGAGSGITELTGDVTAGPGSGSQAATIPNATVTYAKMQDVSAADRLLGRGNGGGAGDVQEITLGTNLSLSGTTLNAAGGGGGAPDDAEYWVGAPNGTLSAEIDLSALTTGFVINTAGTPSAYTGTSCTNQFPRSLSASGAATCASVALASDTTGQLPLANGGTAANLADPGADRILFWDDSAGAVTWLTLGTNLTITGTTIDAAGGGGGALSAITAATATNTIASGNNHSQIWNWALTSDSVTAFAFGETTAASAGTANNQVILGVNTLATSTATASYIKNYGTAASLRIDDVSGDTTPIIFDHLGQLGIGATAPANTSLYLADNGTFYNFRLDYSTTQIGSYFGGWGNLNDTELRLLQNGQYRFQGGVNGVNRIQRDAGTAPTTITGTSQFLQIGDDERVDNGYYLIGFGFSFGGNYANPPAYIGFQDTEGSSFTFGDLVFGTRSTNANTAATERLRILSDGTINIEDLKTTGAATGKNVVCVDTATGKLYASSTGTDCSN